ncbi:MaoC family dehydratase [Ovoidimarina sediminis]|uniref:MaoC family dehydratase n=1 Tax=Ovoidimarina sediminis TaxID=3079856 RepID=UPI00290A8A1A|nr:MaoC family dehydratase [Rhodophyticola sp. MJ-SS7]MDU8946544.1 MaoC family dehydratase [Rhodophyticola sp. MJ-SS7]
MSGRDLPPGIHRFDAVETGDRISTGAVEVTSDMIDAFAALTGDRFAIHMEDAAAREKGFPGRVAHGLLVLSLIDGLKNAAPAQFDAIASLGWTWRFSKPVLIGDRLNATITVAGKRAVADGARGILELDFDVVNQRGETVQAGANRLMVHR